MARKKISFLEKLKRFFEKINMYFYGSKPTSKIFPPPPPPSFRSMKGRGKE